MARPVIYRVRLWPWEDLNALNREDGQGELDPGAVGRVLAALVGKGPNVPRLVAVDDAGQLLLGAGSAAAPQVTRIEGGANTNLADVLPLADGVSPAVQSLQVAAALRLYDGVAVNTARTGASGVLGAQSSFGSLLTASPGQWLASSNPAAGTAASASRAAGAAGVRHVLSGLVLVLSATTALAGITLVTINIRDGASGAGAILASIQVTLPAAVIPVTSIPVPPLNVPGSAATAMTVEGSAGVGNLVESITASGYDAS